ncbi:hypothetical protein KCU67_g1555, partial [Aureobasidium melanogenum]
MAETHSDEDFSTFLDRSFAVDGAMSSPHNEHYCGAHRRLLSNTSTILSGSTDVDQSQATDEVSAKVELLSPSLGRMSPRKNIYTWVWDEWLFEILACTLSLLALVAIVITLAVHDGRPLPEWPFNISVNALVSVFGVILKTSMMLPVSESISQLKWTWFQKPHSLGHFTDFDSASRGPWGCLKVLRRCHVRHLTSVGAAITILALASDPFIQQMIKFRPVTFLLTTDDAHAFIPCTNNYTLHGGHIGAELESLDLLTQAAIYKGVYNSYSPVEATCSSGNCTFGDYRTLGMCSSCQHVSINSSDIHKTCDGNRYCNYTLTDGPVMSMPGTPTILNISTVVSGGEVNNAAPNLSGLSLTRLLGRIGPALDELIAFECTLYPCIRTYTASVAKGNISEVLLSTSPVPLVDSKDNPVFAPFWATPMPCLIDGTFHNATEFTTPNTTNIIPTSGLLPENQTAYLPPSCVFSYADPIGMAEYLATFLSGSVNTWAMATPDWLGQLVAINRTSAYPTFDLIDTAWNALAESLTVHMRQNGDASNSPPAIGAVYQTETRIQVQWPWLSYPASLLLLALAFMVATIYNSALHTRDRVWKGSPLPLMLHGVDDEIRSEQQHKTELKEMEVMARQLRVQIQEKDDGWRLVAT